MNIRAIGLGIGIGLLAAAPALAGPLATDPLALMARTNTVVVAPGASVTVDSAVYAPGVFPGVDPSSGHQYVYAYQVFSQGTMPAGDFFAVLPEPFAGPFTAAAADASYAQTGGRVPTIGSWTYGPAFNYSPRLLAGEFTATLIYTSMVQPGARIGVLHLGPGPGDAVYISNVVTTAPAPGAALVLGASGVAMGFRRRRERLN